VANGLNQPRFVAQPAGDDNSLDIIERQGPSGEFGRILKHDLTLRTHEVFLDFAGSNFTGDEGVLSMGFHPDFAANGECSQRRISYRRLKLSTILLSIHSA
jgi:hypothetical protein